MKLTEKHISVLQFLNAFPLDIQITYWESGDYRPQYTAWWAGMPKITKPTFKFLRKHDLIVATHFYKKFDTDEKDRKLIFRLTMEGKKQARWNPQALNLNNPESEKARNHMKYCMGVLSGE